MQLVLHADWQEERHSPQLALFSLHIEFVVIVVILDIGKISLNKFLSYYITPLNIFQVFYSYFFTFTAIIPENNPNNVEKTISMPKTWLNSAVPDIIEYNAKAKTE